MVECFYLKVLPEEPHSKYLEEIRLISASKQNSITLLKMFKSFTLLKMFKSIT